MATILQLLNSDRNLSLFNKGIRITELESILNETGPFTILGPVNLALGRLISMTYDQLLEPANKEKLLSLLSNYILKGKQMMGDLRNDRKLLSLNGKQVIVTIRNGDTFINEAKVLAHNRQASNGVIHLLDKVYTVGEPV